MASTPSIALSGLGAARAALDAAGHNIANLSTDGFRRERAVQTALPEGGVTSVRERLPQPGAALEADVVGQIEAKHAWMANLAVFRTHDRMMGALLDAEV